ncbi:MAG TPA: serine hydrolase domain-containing protein, partial [Kribbellaceae bacterium]
LIGSGAERGLQVAVFRDGTQVVDVAAGTDATGRAITGATPVHALSTGKGMAATVVHVLAERGVLGYDTRIAEVWPEFGAKGKEAATVRHLLTHAVGLPALPDGVTADDLRDPDAIAARLAESVPAWEPGTQVGYHAQTWGYLTGELVRRAAGRRISEVLRDEVATPLGVADELYFGVPAAEQSRVARLEEAPGYADMVAMFGSPVPPTAELCNRSDVLAADNPAGGVLSARAVARMYAALLGETGGVRLVGPERLRELSAVAYNGTDVVMGMPTLFALGYGIGRPGEQQPVRTVFGMPGVGGSAAWADTATGTAFAITTTRLHPGTAPALARIQELVA